MKTIRSVGVVGAGAMGRGIAQIAAQAGLEVLIHDVSEEAVRSAVDSLQTIWARQVERGRMTASEVDAAMACIRPCAQLDGFSSVDLVVEAIVERLEVKQGLFRQLEGIVGADCILASNTSSLSITAIAQACERPQRVAGYHFFNPVPLMKVVEVIDGLGSDPATGDALMALARTMGHTPVRVRDMPGFLVNHAGRGMNVEGLKTAQEGVAPFYQIDAIMREQAGFRMGPFELMDLTGLDVSHPVMESIYQQFYDEPRFRPSALAAVRVAGQLLGRKTRAGFYTYDDDGRQTPAEPPVPVPPAGLTVWVAPWHKTGHSRATALLNSLNVTVSQADAPPADALILVTPFGEDVSTLVARHGLDGARTLGLDTLFGLEPGRRRVLMGCIVTDERWRDAAHAVMASDGTAVSVIEDSAGFVAQRIVAMIVNIACDIAQQGIATPEDIDVAVSLGLGYPQGGPLSLGDHVGAPYLLEVLQAMQQMTGDMRYRPSPWLQRRAQLGVSLRTEPVWRAQ